MITFSPLFGTRTPSSSRSAPQWLNASMFAQLYSVPEEVARDVMQALIVQGLPSETIDGQSHIPMHAHYLILDQNPLLKARLQAAFDPDLHRD